MSKQVAVPRAGDAFLVMADRVTFRVTDADSGGRLTVVEIDIPPGGGPPPLHIHPPDEVFQVLEGEVTIFEGDPEDAARRVLGPGGCQHVRGGRPHTFRNLTDAPARLLATFAPGRMMERFFVEAGHDVTGLDAMPDLDLEAEVARVFGVGERLGMRLLDVPS